MTKNNKKFHLVCFLMWFIPVSLFGQRYISGHIADDIEGDPIAAVTVFIAGTTAGTKTDAEGYYRLKIPGEGSYILVIWQEGYQRIYKNIDPETLTQKKNWERNRENVYQVSIIKFIKSLYNNSLKKDGFELTSIYYIGGSYKDSIKKRWGPYDPFNRSILSSLDSILTKNSMDESKTLNVLNEVLMLICYGKLGINGEFRNLLRDCVINIYPDGTYTNKLNLISYGEDLNLLLTGLYMTLPIEYISKNSTHYLCAY